MVSQRFSKGVSRCSKKRRSDPRYARPRVPPRRALAVRAVRLSHGYRPSELVGANDQVGGGRRSGPPRPARTPRNFDRGRYGFRAGRAARSAHAGCRLAAQSRRDPPAGGRAGALSQPCRAVGRRRSPVGARPAAAAGAPTGEVDRAYRAPVPTEFSSSWVPPSVGDRAVPATGTRRRRPPDFCHVGDTAGACSAVSVEPAGRVGPPRLRTGPVVTMEGALHGQGARPHEQPSAP